MLQPISFINFVVFWMTYHRSKYIDIVSRTGNVALTDFIISIENTANSTCSKYFEAAVQMISNLSFKIF